MLTGITLTTTPHARTLSRLSRGSLTDGKRAGLSFSALRMRELHTFSRCATRIAAKFSVTASEIPGTGELMTSQKLTAEESRAGSHIMAMRSEF